MYESAFVGIFIGFVVLLLVAVWWFEQEDRRRMIKRLNLKEGDPLLVAADHYLTQEAFRECRTRQHLAEMVDEGRRYADDVRHFKALQPRKGTQFYRRH